jgi:hypothetical protein
VYVYSVCVWHKERERDCVRERDDCAEKEIGWNTKRVQNSRP